MATSGFTLKSLELLEQAISEGALRVRYSDKLVEYRSLSEMLQVRDLMRKELGLIKKAGARKNSQFSKGL